MDSVVIGSDVFSLLSSTSILESQYEVLLQQSSQRLFPGLRYAQFKLDVSVDGISKRPDFALIDPDYRAWWVIEAELSHHSWSHVEEQVSVFSAGKYENRHAEALVDQVGNGHFDADKVLDLVMSQQPRVAVIVHGRESQTESWREGLATFGCQFAHVNIYRSLHNKHALVVNGKLPNADDLPSVDTGTDCVKSSVTPKWIKVLSPAMLPVGDMGDVEIEICGDTTVWQRRDMAGVVELMPKLGDPLLQYGVGSKFRLVPSSDGRLIMKEGSNG